MDYSKVFLVLLSLIELSYSARILMWPYCQGFNSRLMNIEKMSNILIEAGHTVDWIITEHYDETKRPLSSDVTVHKFNVPEDVPLITDEGYVEQFIDISPAKILPILREITDQFCESLIKSGILRVLKEKNYDVMILDYIDYCGRIGIDYLGIPTMLYSNFGFITSETMFPNPMSFVPHFTTALSDDMTFTERFQNTLTILMFSTVGIQYFTRGVRQLKQEYGLNFSLPLENAHMRAAMTINHAHWAFDYPQPLLPYHIMVGGLYFTDAKPLDPFFDNIMTSSPNGVIIVSFGTLFNRFNSEKNEQLALGFAKLKQTVIWKYKGDPLKNKGSNTYLVDWMPQNDLLGHPNVRLFVTHCGISSAYETMYHGVPIVAIPMIFDQQGNARKLTRTRANMGEELSMHSLTSESLKETIELVLGEPKYKSSAIEMSKKVRTNLVSPKETLLYWVQQVAMNGSHGYLHPIGPSKMHWAQYHQLDVMAVLAICLVIVTVVIVFTCRCCIRGCSNRLRKQKKD
ncbi:unnamed protein product [Owenia fusiformis]|uniref:UDP-glucuronosyltransferase n=1 Tax=Owenia fusiformis TaxID=6347 RepID=A0A8S4NVQ0_OWEFU|nr:unnamed protein product [Owenia fusiformis]